MLLLNKTVKTVQYPTCISFIENKNKITRIFSCTNCADELFIQTIAYNCGFKKNIYQPDLNQRANLRYIDWNRGNNGNPYTFKSCDKNLLIPSDNDKNKDLFARKFSETIDKNIDKESAIITIKIIVFPIVSFVIMIFGIFFSCRKVK